MKFERQNELFHLNSDKNQQGTSGPMAVAEKEES